MGRQTSSEFPHCCIRALEKLRHADFQNPSGALRSIRYVILPPPEKPQRLRCDLPVHRRRRRSRARSKRCPRCDPILRHWCSRCSPHGASQQSRLSFPKPLVHLHAVHALFHGTPEPPQSGCPDSRSPSQALCQEYPRQQQAALSVSDWSSVCSFTALYTPSLHISSLSPDSGRIGARVASGWIFTPPPMNCVRESRSGSSAALAGT